MQKLIYIFLAGILICCMGCSEKIVEPEISQVQNGIIALPEKGSLSVEGGNIDIDFINGDKGGKLSVSYSYNSGRNNKVSINVDVDIPRGAFKGTRLIIAGVSTFAGVEFWPDMVFDKPVLCDAKFSGLDLKGINSADIQFGFLAPDGSFEPCENDGITVNQSSGTLTVNNAKLYHFSRYSFFH